MKITIDDISWSQYTDGTYYIKDGELERLQALGVPFMVSLRRFTAEKNNPGTGITEYDTEAGAVTEATQPKPSDSNNILIFKDEYIVKEEAWGVRISNDGMWS